jgi:flagella basal body P-ring formation protein FlgA
MRHAFLTAFACLLATGAHAQVAPLDEGALRAFVSQHVASAGPQVTRFEIQFGTVAPRADLAPCARTELFLPSAARPWGRMAVGMRCVQGAMWTLMVPTTVRAWGTALVAAAPLAAGVVPTAADVREEEIELSREPGTVLREASALQGRALVRPLQAGQAFRADALRAVQVVQAGDPVRLRIAGAGFAVTATGQALAGAAEGQALRVRTEFGKVLTGVAREGRVVDVAL